MHKTLLIVLAALRDPGNSSLKIDSFHCLQLPHQQLKNLELDGMMEDLILVKAGPRVEAYLRMDRGSQKREEQHQEMESELGHQVKLILTTKMIRI